MTSTKPTHRGRWYWETFSPTDRYAGQDLAALRKGIGRPAGDVPEMWPFYRSIVREYSAGSPRLIAEHAALGLFATHQQSQRTSMHAEGIGLGTAARRLKQAGKHRQEAVDQRMHKTATATSVDELVSHLRGLITLLRSISQPLDYSLLHRDIERWHHAQRRTWTRTRWGSEYFDWSAGDNGKDPDASGTGHAPKPDEGA